MGPIQFLKRYERTKFYDLAAAAPLFVYYGWILWHDAPVLLRNYRIVRFGYADAAFLAEALGQFLAYLFIGLLVALLLVRKVPRGKSETPLPRIVAALGAFVSVAFLHLPPAQLSAAAGFAASLLIVAGLVGMILSLAWLGRSFSIMPEARTLVTCGPYRVVRHPLYLSEEVALFGIMLHFAQPWSLLLFAVQFALQLARMHFEEKILRAHFPAYAAYAARTRRLIPGVY